MVVFLGIQPRHVPKEPQQEGLDPFRDWQAACSAPNRLICSVSGIRDPKDFPQTPGVEGSLDAPYVTQPNVTANLD